MSHSWNNPSYQTQQNSITNYDFIRVSGCLSGLTKGLGEKLTSMLGRRFRKTNDIAKIDEVEL